MVGWIGPIRATGSLAEGPMQISGKFDPRAVADGTFKAPHGTARPSTSRLLAMTPDGDSCVVMQSAAQVNADDQPLRIYFPGEARLADAPCAESPALA